MSKRNIIFFGPPASGKSTLANLLAQQGWQIVESPSRWLHNLFRQISGWDEFSSMSDIPIDDYTAFQRTFLAVTELQIQAIRRGIERGQRYVLTRSPLDAWVFTEWWGWKFKKNSQDFREFVQWVANRTLNLTAELTEVLAPYLLVMFPDYLVEKDEVRNFDKSDLQWIQKHSIPLLCNLVRKADTIIELPRIRQTTPESRLELVLKYAVLNDPKT